MRNHTETAQIIQLFAPRPKPGKRLVPIANHSSNPQCEGDVSDTVKIFVSGKSVIMPGEKPPRLWTIGMPR